MQNTVLIKNSRTTWPSKIPVPWFLRQFTPGCLFYFSKNVLFWENAKKFSNLIWVPVRDYNRCSLYQFMQQRHNNEGIPRFGLPLKFLECSLYSILSCILRICVRECLVKIYLHGENGKFLWLFTV